jgi:hypothetical protein
VRTFTKSVPSALLLHEWQLGNSFALHHSRYRCIASHTTELCNAVDGWPQSDVCSNPGLPYFAPEASAGADSLHDWSDLTQGTTLSSGTSPGLFPVSVNFASCRTGLCVTPYMKRPLALALTSKHWQTELLYGPVFFFRDQQLLNHETRRFIAVFTRARCISYPTPLRSVK